MVCFLAAAAVFRPAALDGMQQDLFWAVCSFLQQAASAPFWQAASFFAFFLSAAAFSCATTGPAIRATAANAKKSFFMAYLFVLKIGHLTQFRNHRLAAPHGLLQRNVYLGAYRKVNIHT